MQRVTISLDERLAEDFDRLAAEQGYQSRSEAVRDLVRQAVDGHRLVEAADGHCVASLSYIFEHGTRRLAQRLVELQHDHHDLVVTSTRAPLDHDVCLETVMLKGGSRAVRAFADAVRAERGVRFAAINLISVTPNDHHDHDGEGHVHDEGAHLTPHQG
ncbi:nickel-responsive transcriptional regulator NikR [Caulobacter sp. SSI4214]|uniref:nickel-responsive transcriptional regulator NikR n=1 Tax=Caulobacter sp. SSI4214 TaxID=2575739 RepID=UPI00143BC0F9|nr:nickel-responsive transcriptional regulator NikR [Caulobacter sp. SSI4214]